MKKLLSHQFNYLIAFLCIGILLSSAEYLQYYKGVNPCPLCILQRFAFGALGLLFLIGTVWASKRWSQLGIGILTILASIIGIIFSGRQVWLQYLPVTSNGDNCEVSLQYMLQVFPLNEVIKKVYAGGSGCSQVGWELFHLSLAQWSLVAFVVFLIFGFWQLRRA